ncbi:MAG TPA: rRNA maturation RNase YbeY [Candidatus Dormibacteraeota bacterium]|nr:rRNA maturation RNase YbeY [Candidatus Dormibacteraeota bacterium]
MVERARLEVEVFKAIRVPVPPAFLRGLLRRAAQVPEVGARLPAGLATIAVRLTTEDELRRLNHDFAGNDSVTDVLSFGGSDQHLGDLAISWPTVLRQSQEFGEPERTELGLIAVHGLLHLLGWDHESAAERREMTRITLAALALSGLTIPPGRL